MQKTLKIAYLLTALTLTACAPSRGPVTATERTLCRIWGESLPTRSRADTAQTQADTRAFFCQRASQGNGSDRATRIGYRGKAAAACARALMADQSPVSTRSLGATQLPPAQITFGKLK